jgi:hypothetical protein
VRWNLIEPWQRRTRLAAERMENARAEDAVIELLLRHGRDAPRLARGQPGAHHLPDERREDARRGVLAHHALAPVRARRLEIGFSDVADIERERCARGFATKVERDHDAAPRGGGAGGPQQGAQPQ